MYSDRQKWATEPCQIAFSDVEELNVVNNPQAIHGSDNRHQIHQRNMFPNRILN